MSLPIYLTSAMAGAPSLNGVASGLLAVLDACLVTGFNTKSVSSATAAGGVVTFNFAANPNFSALDTVAIAGSSVPAVNGSFRVQSSGSNQVLVSMPGVADGAVGGTMTMKFAPLGWEKPFTTTDVAVYRPSDLDSVRSFYRVYSPAPTLNVGGVTQNVFVQGYVDMTDVNTGTDPFPSAAMSGGFPGSRFVSAPSGVSNYPWWLVGDSKSVYLFYKHQAGGQAFSMGFGEIKSFKAMDLYRGFVSAGTEAGGSTYGGPNNCGTSGWSRFMPRSWTGSVATSIKSFNNSLAACASNFANGGRFGVYPDAISGNLTLAGPVLCTDASASGTIRGCVPGQLELLCTTASGQFAQGGTVISSVPGVGGRVVVMAAYVSSSAFVLDEEWV